MSISRHSGICIVAMCSSVYLCICSHFAVTEENNVSLRQAGSEVAGYKEVQRSNTRCKAQYCWQQDGYLRPFLITTFWWTYILGLANLFLIANCNYIVYVFLIVWMLCNFPFPFVNLEADLRLTHKIPCMNCYSVCTVQNFASNTHSCVSSVGDRVPMGPTRPPWFPWDTGQEGAHSEGWSGW